MRVGTVIGFQNPPEWRAGWEQVYDTGLRFAVHAEAAGLDQIWLTEHHFAEDGYCPALLPVAGAIAARTSRIRIGTKVLLMPFHDPVRLSEDAAVVDLLSGGRLDLGVAAGYRRQEFAGFGIDRRERAARTAEGLKILRLALSGETFSFDGTFHCYRDVRVTPPPAQRPVPIWVGGRSAAALRRAAAAGHHLQLADFDAGAGAADCAVYRAALAEHGRDPEAYEIAAVAMVFVDEDGERARRIAEPHMRYQQAQYRRWFEEAGDRVSPRGPARGHLPPGCLAGTPGDVLEKILAARERVPFTHFSFWMLLPGMRSEVAEASLDLFAREVLPRLRAVGPRAACSAVR